MGIFIKNLKPSQSSLIHREEQGRLTGLSPLAGLNKETLQLNIFIHPYKPGKMVQWFIEGWGDSQWELLLHLTAD